MNDPTLDKEYEKLLIARVHEGMSEAYKELDNEREADSHLIDFYNTFPQLVPFSNLKMRLKLVAPAEGGNEMINSILSI